MKTPKSLITLRHVSTRIRDRKILEDTSLTIHDKESWAVIGPNGSGKTTLTRLMIGECPVVHGTMELARDFDPARDIAVVSFETQKRLFASENRKEDARQYSGHVLEFTSVREVLESAATKNGEILTADLETLSEITGITRLLKRNVTRLSTGEFRKVLVAKALLSHPRLLILDEPMEGLDERSRSTLSDFVSQLIKKGVQVIYVTHRTAAIPQGIDRVICLNHGKVVAIGKRENILDPGFIDALYHRSFDQAKDVIRRLYSSDRKTSDKDMVVMRDVRVRYGDIEVLDGITWTVRYGEKWMVKGANGSGKTTLLSLIAGDNPQAYSNSVTLFGTRRGSGESIWDIKKRIGLVSSEFQLRYQKDMTVLDVVLSGFFDSVGLFRKPSPSQVSKATDWISALGFDLKSTHLFTHLSFGEQKLVLIARAMVKSPELLILDEPCQGLDPVNRRMVLHLIRTLGQIPETTLIYVTHHSDEILTCFNRVLEL